METQTGRLREEPQCGIVQRTHPIQGEAPGPWRRCTRGYEHEGDHDFPPEAMPRTVWILTYGNPHQTGRWLAGVFSTEALAHEAEGEYFRPEITAAHLDQVERRP